MFETTSTQEQFAEMRPEYTATYLAEVAAPLFGKQAKEKFDAMLGSVVHRHLGDGPAAEEAVASGTFVVEGNTTVLRLNPQTDCVEIYVDMGLPGASSDQAEIYGKLLEMNLNAAHYGVLFGRNEHSKRLVASLRVHIGLMDGEGEFCAGCLQMITEAIRSVRTW